MPRRERQKIIDNDRMLKALAEKWGPAIDFIGRFRAEVERWSG